MSSSALTGERRWASARRGGMTVLGKVAAPKPLNLPSQRLENHGLDPNVEIVPKGTLSWGSRSSSSSSNAWISSSSSPNAAGGTTSPSHLSGRPSSGGSGTRPSTAGSDRTHEAVSNVWAPNSRPSSASGKLLSNQTSSTPLRPRSAENRPNSSQLSRFAEPVSESSVAWGPSNTAERLGIKSSKEDGFSLSSGDFPTLGSEKDPSVKTIESEDHARPSSASGRISHAKEDTRSQADVKHGTVNSWRTDGPRSAEDGIHPNMEKWQGEPQQYYNANVPPQHFDAWRGPPPINAPAGVWYRGRPPGPPFGAPHGPGGFPMEPFPYYRPQIPPPPLAGSQPVPPSAGGPRGPHPKNGDLFRPQMPDAYARPGMPYRPGFYPGPPGPPGPMSFEGYYGPPMGYCNNERDIPYMGMGPHPPVYNGYPGPGAPDIGNSHGRVGGRGPAGKTLPEQVEGDYFEDKQGPRRVPLRNHDEWDRKEGENWEHDIQPNFSNPGKGSIPMIANRKNEWGAEEDTEEDMFSKRRPSERSSRSSEYRGHSADRLKVKSFEGMGPSNVKQVNDNWTAKSEKVASFHPEMLQPTVASDRDSSLPAATKDPVLMQKIEGLNAKIRVYDGRNDASSGFNKEEQVNRSQHEQVGDKLIQPIATMVARRPYHGGQDRVDHRGKGKFNSQDADGWRKKPLTPESPSAVTASKIESASNTHMQGPSLVGEAAENSMINPPGKNEGDSAETYDDSTDIHVQRAKMRELAKQRALQLQKEEEERTREQKAKALAKLEELNRRTLSGEVTNQKAEEIEVNAEIPGEQESHTLGESVMVDLKFQEPSVNQVSNNPVINPVDRESVEVTGKAPLEMEHTGLLESDVSHGHPMHEDAHNGNTKKVTSSQLSDGGNSRHKRTGYKQKQNNSLQKSLNEKSVPNVVASEAPKDHILVGTIAITPQAPLSEIKQSGPNTSHTVIEPSAHQKRKNNRNSKNKHKPDENPPDVNLGKDLIETGESKSSFSTLDNSASTVIEPDTGVQAQDGWSSLPNEEPQSRVTNQWKPQPSRRMPRSQQPNRFVDKLHGGDSVKWAPVGTQNKAKGSDEASQKSIQESANNSTKGDNTAQISSKGKRAEMERYVPKPVAKELAQQGSSDSSHTKSGHLEPTLMSEPTKDVQLSKDQNQLVKCETNLTGAETNTSGLINTSDGYNISNNTTTAAFSKYPAMKDQGATGRGKRYQPRVPRSSGNNNHNPENISSGEMHASDIRSDVNQTDRTIVSKENRSIGERTSSHWQPKSHSNAANNEHGNRTSGSESVTTEINRLPKKDHPQHKVQVPPRHDKESGSVNQPHPGQSVKSNVAEESILGHPQDSHREKKPAPAKGRPYSPNQDPAGSTEQLERNISSGSRRNWSQNSRSIKGHESRGEWSSGAFREKPRQNVHYEYQPIGPYKDSKPEKSEEPADSVGTRYRERGQSHPKRGGNFHRRQSGAIRVESGQQD